VDTVAGLPGACRILSLDGGGAKGFYTLGVLKEIEAMVGTKLAARFDLIYGTSTGAIIAALLGLGRSVDEIHTLYTAHVPRIMGRKTRAGRTHELSVLTAEVFGTLDFTEFKTKVGIVAARWLTERPMIFKSTVDQIHGAKATYKPGFGVPISAAVQASCSAFPFFERTFVATADGDRIELIDGGYCANNPTLYAISDAARALNVPRHAIRVVSIGVGEYPPKKSLLMWLIKRFPFNSIELLQKTMEINTQSMDALRLVLFNDVATIRISDAFTQPEMATDLLESNLEKLSVLRQRGKESFRSKETELRAFMS
jgi:uncharacterized protein